ncbi:MAG TPA: hypothetical protein DCP63_10845 [Bacteroidetes bacterium]|nr:hypothetical protein [Bacteroidota bacterium]
MIFFDFVLPLYLPAEVAFADEGGADLLTCPPKLNEGGSGSVGGLTLRVFYLFVNLNSSYAK